MTDSTGLIHPASLDNPVGEHLDAALSPNNNSCAEIVRSLVRAHSEIFDLRRSNARFWGRDLSVLSQPSIDACDSDLHASQDYSCDGASPADPQITMLFDELTESTMKEPPECLLEPLTALSDVTAELLLDMDRHEIEILDATPFDLLHTKPRRKKRRSSVNPRSHLRYLKIKKAKTIKATF